MQNFCGGSFGLGSAAGFYVATRYPKSGICRKSPFGSFHDFCPLKLRQCTFGCPSEHRMRPSDFVSALMNVRRKRAAAGQLCEAHSLVVSNMHEASFVRGGSYRIHEDVHLGRLKIASASVSDGQPKRHSRSVARTQNLSQMKILQIQ